MSKLLSFWKKILTCVLLSLNHYSVFICWWMWENVLNLTVVYITDSVLLGLNSQTYVEFLSDQYPMHVIFISAYLIIVVLYMFLSTYISICSWSIESYKKDKVQNKIMLLYVTESWELSRVPVFCIVFFFLSCSSVQSQECICTDCWWFYV